MELTARTNSRHVSGAILGHPAAFKLPDDASWLQIRPVEEPYSWAQLKLLTLKIDGPLKREGTMWGVWVGQATGGMKSEYVWKYSPKG